MKTFCVIVIMLLGSALSLSAQSCPDLTQYPQGDICTASPSQIYWYYYLGDETDTYAWYVTGGTIVGGGGPGDWYISIIWTPGAPFKQVAIEKWTQWGAYCTDVIAQNC